MRLLYINDLFSYKGFITTQSLHSKLPLATGALFYNIEQTSIHTTITITNTAIYNFKKKFKFEKPTEAGPIKFFFLIKESRRLNV